MAKKRVNKTRAVREYLDAHPGAMSSEIAKALNARNIKISPAHVSNIKSKIMREGGAKANGGPAPAAAQAPAAAAEKAAKPGDTITLEQIKKVAQTVKAIGGFDRLKELLEVVREVGGLRRFKDLLEAMAATETAEVKQ